MPSIRQSSAGRKVAGQGRGRQRDGRGHYNLATSYQALGQRAEAARSRSASAAGGFLLQDSAIIQCLSRIEDRSGLPVRNEAIFGAPEIAAITENTFLRCALGATIILGVRLTIAAIKSFLDEKGLAFLGFELDAKIVEQFRQQNTAADALTNLDAWAAFEVVPKRRKRCRLAIEKGPAVSPGARESCC